MQERNLCQQVGLKTSLENEICWSETRCHTPTRSTQEHPTPSPTLPQETTLRFHSVHQCRCHGINPQYIAHSRVIALCMNIYTFAPNHTFGLSPVYPSTSPSVPPPRPRVRFLSRKAIMQRGIWASVGLHKKHVTCKRNWTAHVKGNRTITVCVECSTRQSTVQSGSLTLSTVSFFPRRDEIVSTAFLQVILLNLQVKFMLQFGVENSFCQPLSQKL